MVQIPAGRWRTKGLLFALTQLNLIRKLSELTVSQLTAMAAVALIMTLALLTVLEGFALQQSVQLSHVLTYLAIATLASRVKLNIPLLHESLSVNSLIIIFGIIQFSLPQTLVLACCLELAQYLRQERERRDIFKSLFSLLSVTAAIGLSDHLFHWSWWAPHVHPVVRCVLVACCYFLTNALSAVVGILLAEKTTVKTLWRNCDIGSFRSYLFGAVLVWLFSETTVLFGWEAALSAIYLMNHICGFYLRPLGTDTAHAGQLAGLHMRTIEALALAIEAKDHTTHDHLRRVQFYAMEVGKEMNLSSDELSALRAAALLHDIGKLAVPEHIISKPGKLTPEEFEKMKIHPIVGAEILERVEFPYPVVPIVAAHHEKWDGSGYPLGLKGDQIPIGARILSVVDCLDALASDRQYRRAIPLDAAMEVLFSESGTAFDPQVVSILNRRYVELEHMAKCQHAAKLSTDCVVERGSAPAAGFEGGWASTELDAKPVDFLRAIAAARQEAQILFEMAQDLGNSLSLNETLSVMAVRMEKIIPYNGLAVYLKTEGKLTPAFVTGDDFRLFSALEIPLGEGLSGWVAENKKPIVNGNPSVEPGYLNDPTRFSILQSALAVPLEGIDGVVGVLALYHAQKDAFKRDHLRILMAITPKLALSIENNLKYHMVKDSAATDYLTGLPNARSLFVHLEGEVSRCLRTKTSLTVLACDLDGFKLVNDRYGHLEGNRMLRLVGEAMRSVCRDYDYVARMGGDEFVIILPGVSEETVDTMIERFRVATREIGWSICGQGVLSLSVGRAVMPIDGNEAEVLLAEADMRMYKTKRICKIARESAASTLALSKALSANPISPGGMQTENTYELASRPDIWLQLGGQPRAVDRR